MTTDTTTKRQIRADFPVKDSPAGKAHYRHFSSPEAVLAYCRNTAPVREQIIDRVSTGSERYHGLAGQDIDAILTTGIAKNALDCFNRADAKLSPDSLRIGGRAIPAITGGAWVIPQFLAGNPMCARAKPRARLPHKDFHVSFRADAGINQSDISTTAAALVRGLWNYTLGEGSATLRVTYVFGYGKTAPDGAKALLVSLDIPLASKNSAALGFSTAMYRSILMSIASRLTSPVDHDVIPHKDGFRPRNTISLSGDSFDDKTTLAALGIDY